MEWLSEQLWRFNSIQDYMYGDFHETIIAKQLYRIFSTIDLYVA